MTIMRKRIGQHIVRQFNLNTLLIAALGFLLKEGVRKMDRNNETLISVKAVQDSIVTWKNRVEPMIDEHEVQIRDLEKRYP
jgi:hypothetical protein